MAGALVAAPPPDAAPFPDSLLPSSRPRANRRRPFLVVIRRLQSRWRRCCLGPWTSRRPHRLGRRPRCLHRRPLHRCARPTSSRSGSSPVPRGDGHQSPGPSPPPSASLPDTVDSWTVRSPPVISIPPPARLASLSAINEPVMVTSPPVEKTPPPAPAAPTAWFPVSRPITELDRTTSVPPAVEDATATVGGPDARGGVPVDERCLTVMVDPALFHKPPPEPAAVFSRTEPWFFTVTSPAVTWTPPPWPGPFPPPAGSLRCSRGRG